VSDTSAPPPAGWYPDPLDDGAWRWWDGAAWTTEVRATEAEAAAPAATASSAAEVSTPETDEHDDAAAPPEGSVAEPDPEPGPAREWLPIDHRYVTYSEAVDTTSLDGEHADTTWIWLLAFAPYLMAVVAGLAQAFGLRPLMDLGFEPLIAGSATLATGLLVPWILGGLDVGALRRRGFQPPSILWMFLLPPMAYFIARGRRLRKQGARSRGPVIAFWIVIGSQVLGVAIGLAYAGTAIVGLMNAGLL